MDVARYPTSPPLASDVPYPPPSLFNLSSTMSWDDTPARSEFHDLDVGEYVAVGGRLHTGAIGILIMQRTHNGWTQRGRFTTSHLNRDYVCGERLDDILERWMPVDFSSADAVRIRAQQRGDVWLPFEDGTPTIEHLDDISSRFRDNGT